MAKRSKVGKFFTPKTVISGIVILIAIAAAIGANVIVPYDPNEVDPRSCFLPAFSKGHILGTDKLGRDLLSRLIMGAKSSMLNAFLIVAFEVVIGSLLNAQLLNFSFINILQKNNRHINYTIY